VGKPVRAAGPEQKKIREQWQGEPTAWWKLDEKEGKTASDSTGRNHTGELVGNPQWQAEEGKMGGSLKFSGEEDAVRIPHSEDLVCREGITVAAWFKIPKFDRDYQAIVTKGDSAWRLHREKNTGNISFVCEGLAGYHKVVSREEMDDGKWHHAAGIFDGQNVYLYIDGKLDGMLEDPGMIAGSDDDVYIGDNAERRGRTWNGWIDDVRIYNFALQEDEIASLAGIEPTSLTATETHAKPDKPGRNTLSVLVIFLVVAGLVLLLRRRKKPS